MIYDYSTVDLTTIKSTSKAMLEDLVSKMAEHIEEIMFKSPWDAYGNYYCYDFTTYPVFDFANGVYRPNYLFESGNAAFFSNGIVNFFSNGIVDIPDNYEPQPQSQMELFVLAQWVLYPTILTTSVAKIYRDGQSTSVMVPYWNENLPIPPLPNPLYRSQFQSNLNSVNCPDDFQGAHTGQCFKIPQTEVFGWGLLPLNNPPETGFFRMAEFLTFVFP